MNNKEMNHAFTPQQQASYEEQLVKRYGDKVKKHIAEAKANTANWSKAKNEQAQAEWEIICGDLAKAREQSAAAESDIAQAIITRHFEWIKQFWTPDHDSYVGLGLGYTAYEWKPAFDKHDAQHPKLAEFMAAAMETFANRNLK